MREILFRGKRMDNGEWVYGASIILGNKVDDGTVGCALALQKNTKFWCINDQSDNVCAIVDTVFYKVDHSTIGQYTGLRDKNGKRIFEDDIVESSDFNEEDGYAIICWDEYTARFVVEGRSIRVDFDNYYGFDVCVIGNIHDNPELLRGDGK